MRRREFRYIVISALMMSMMMTGCGKDVSESSSSVSNVSAESTASDENGSSDENQENGSKSSDNSDSSASADSSDKTDGSDNSNNSNSSNSSESLDSSEENKGTSSLAGMNDEEQFTDRDKESTYDESEAVKISLSGSGASSDSSSVSIEGSNVTITKEGTYVLEGTLSDGQIIVDVADTEKVQLVLNGVDISCSNSACVYVKSADKVFITLADGSENTLKDTGAAYDVDGEEKT